MKCLCADLTDDEFNRLFHPFFGADMAFNIMQGPNADLSLSKCSWSAFDSVSWMRADKFDSKAVDLTSKLDVTIHSCEKIINVKLFLFFRYLFLRHLEARWKVHVAIANVRRLGRDCQGWFVQVPERSLETRDELDL